MPHLPFALLVLVLSSLSLCADAVTVWLAGDSTTASRVGSHYVGWGAELQRYLSVNVQNMAMAGQSLRSFTAKGYCTYHVLSEVMYYAHMDADCPLAVEWMYNHVEEGDIVIIEFGHFEGGGPTGSTQNTLCPGLDPTVTCERCLTANP